MLNINSVNDLLNTMTIDIYRQLQRAVELGKWPSGQVLTAEQRDLCLQACIAYEQKFLPPEEHAGYIPPKAHQHCGSQGDIAEADDEQILNLKSSD